LMIAANSSRAEHQVTLITPSRTGDVAKK